MIPKIDEGVAIRRAVIIFALSTLSRMKISKDRSVCFSGHRDMAPRAQGDLFGCPADGWAGCAGDPAMLRDAIGRVLREAVARQRSAGRDTFLCGMAEGFDMLAAETVIAMQRDDPGIKLVAVVPFEGQERFFAPDDRARYAAILACAAATVLLSPNYRRDCFHRRNDYLVENSSALVCWFDGRPGGTAYTVKAAVRAGLEVWNLLDSGAESLPED